ncbi:MAG: pyridoxamine 5'-phosphate oxidase family protein [Oscillibacter sp.]|nr:pyridoxamine 5'-phosphate oxidase family protein [Oscillibacter sp.]
MFREMRRKKQQLSQEECVEVLEREPRGVLSVLGEGGWPYGVPMDFWYCPEDGNLYFHSAKTGHKLDAVKRCDKASFCVMDSGFRREGEWALNIRSVIVFGRVRLVEDHQRALEICRSLAHKFTRDEAYIEEEIRRSGAGVLCFALVPEHMTGKLVNES